MISLSRYFILPNFQHFLLLLFAVSIMGCNIINPAEPIPSYIKVDSFEVAQSSTLGSTSNKITDVYVYVDTKFQGAYPVNSTFPILESGSHNLLFYAGISINGISGTPTIYPFYQPMQQTINLVSGQVIAVAPVVAYSANVECSWCEDFENAGISLSKTTISDTGIVALGFGDVNNFEGTSGVVYLDNTNSFFELATTIAYELPKSQSPVYLEMNYKCNNSFVVGMIVNTTAGNSQISVITINPKEAWNKIYIDLTSVVSSYPDAYDYKIVIGAAKNDGVTDAKFYFDNLKLLHN